MTHHSQPPASAWPALQFSEIGRPELIADGFLFTEGPVWNHSEGYLLFSDIAGDTIYQWTPPYSVEVFRQPSRNSNGLAFDRQGCMLAAEHGSRSVTRLNEDGTWQTLADSYQGRKLHSPNDIAVRSDNTIYFTDPPFGLGRRTAELDFMGLYRLDPKGKISLEGEYNQYLNGVALSPDEQTLYLALTAADEILAMDVAPDGSTGHVRTFARVPYPDGMAVDLAGNLYIAGEDGVEVWTPQGGRLGTIRTARQPANCAFAGPQGKWLVITARDCVYRVEVPLPGF